MMKRSLAVAAAVSTLMVGNAHAAEDFKVGISGFLNAGILLQDVQDSNRDYDMSSIRTDNVVNINGETVLDNGLKVSAVAGFSLSQDGRTRPQKGSADQTSLYTEDLYVSVGGSFGDVSLGRRRNAGALLHTFIPSVGIGTYGVDDARTNAFVGGVTGMTTATSISNSYEYANRIIYFTPRIEGLQIAASFTPETDGDQKLSNTGFSRYNEPTVQNEYSIGANYTKDFNGFVYTGSLGYTGGDAGGARTAAVGPAVQRDPEAFSAGASLSYNGITGGGAWGLYRDPLQTAGYEQRYGGGLKYETGPYTFGGSMLRRETSAPSGQGFTLANGQAVRVAHLYEVGAKYALGPGVSTGAAVYYNDNQKKQNGAGAPEDSIAGLVNLSVNF